MPLCSIVLLNTKRTWQCLPVNRCLPVSHVHIPSDGYRNRNREKKKKLKSTSEVVQIVERHLSLEREVKFKLALSFVLTLFPVGDMEHGERLQEAPCNNTLLLWCLTKTARVSQAKQKNRNFFSAFPGKGSELPHYSSHSLSLAPTIGKTTDCWSAPTLLHALPRSLALPHGTTWRDQCCSFTSTGEAHYHLNSKDCPSLCING